MARFEFASAWDPFWKYVTEEDSSVDDSLRKGNTSKRSGKRMTLQTFSTHAENDSSVDDRLRTVNSKRGGKGVTFALPHSSHDHVNSSTSRDDFDSQRQDGVRQPRLTSIK